MTPRLMGKSTIIILLLLYKWSVQSTRKLLASQNKVIIMINIYDINSTTRLWCMQANVWNIQK